MTNFFTKKTSESVFIQNGIKMRRTHLSPLCIRFCGSSPLFLPSQMHQLKALELRPSL